MRSHPKANTFLTVLLQMLSDPEFGHEIPHTLGTLLSDMKDVLSEELHAEVRLMYKQRVFLQALPAVMALLDVGGKRVILLFPEICRFVANKQAFQDIIMRELKSIVGSWSWCSFKPTLDRAHREGLCYRPCQL